MNTADDKRETIFSPMFEDFEESLRDQENRWFDNEHVPQRLLTPGFLRAERYERSPWAAFVSRNPAPRYLNFYFVADPAAVTSAAYELQAEHTSVRARRDGRARKGRSFREVWDEETRMRAGHRRHELAVGPKTLLMRGYSEAAQTVDDEPEFRLSCPGVLGYQRFLRNDDVAFSRPRAHRAPKMMELYWLTAPEVATSSTFRAVSDRLPELARPVPRSVVWEGLYLQRPSPWELIVDYD